MSEPSVEQLATFADVLEAFVVAQRAQALGEVRKQKIKLSRPIGNITVKTEVDVVEGATAEEIFNTFGPIDQALDRLKAKTELFYWLGEFDESVRLLGVAIGKRAELVSRYRRENDARNEGRRVPIVYTDHQNADLKSQETSIAGLREDIERHQRKIVDCKRTLFEGAEPLEVYEQRIYERLDQLRGGERPDAA